MSAAPGAAAAAIATAAVALTLCGFFIAEDRFCDRGDTFYPGFGFFFFAKRGEYFGKCLIGPENFFPIFILIEC